MRAHRSLSGLLAGGYLLLLVYASLYPFEGWRWPAGAQLSELLSLSWPPWRSRFDEWANFLGYLPFGAVLFAMVIRNGGTAVSATLLSLAAPALASYTLEFLQHFIPGRFPSMRDWVNNVLGATVGASLCALAQATGVLDQWHRIRERWFLPQSAPAVVLLLLWPMALLFPAPVPLGVGQIGPELREWVLWAVERTPWEGAVAPLLADGHVRASGQLPALREALIMALGLLAPCLLAHVVTRRGWRRWLLPPGAAILAVVVMTLSTALNFGPDHAWTWMTPHVLQTLSLAAAAGLLLAIAGPRLCAALGLVALTALTVLVAEAPADPYYAASLQGWEQGRFIRFHGLAHWVGLVWPYAAMAWLMARLVRRSR